MNEMFEAWHCALNGLLAWQERTYGPSDSAQKRGMLEMKTGRSIQEVKPSNSMIKDAKEVEPPEWTNEVLRARAPTLEAARVLWNRWPQLKREFPTGDALWEWVSAWRDGHARIYNSHSSVTLITEPSEEPSTRVSDAELSRLVTNPERAKELWTALPALQAEFSSCEVLWSFVDATYRRRVARIWKPTAT
jgi:hypothetical protein